MKSLFSFTFVFLTLNLTALAFAADPSATITLTSYYPAPFGAYERLRLVPRADLDAELCTDGSLYFKDSDKSLQICKDTHWTAFGELWSMTSHPASADFDPYASGVAVDQYFPSGDYNDPTKKKPWIGIGTNDPKNALHIVINNPGTPEALIIENLATTHGTPGPGANISFRGMKGGSAEAEYVGLRAVYQNLTDAAAESSFSIFLRAGVYDPSIRERFTFKGNGFLGIRDTQPAAVLELAGDGGVAPNTLAYMMISTNTDPSNNGNIFTVTKDGNVGINIKTPTEKLEIVGNIKGTNLILTSDATLKKDIMPLTNALEKISRLNGVSFEWKDNANDTRKHMGVIAQDVEKVFPEIVYGQEGAKGVDYPSLIAPLIEAVKELKTKNDTLAQELSRQSDLIHNQEEQIKSLENSFDQKESLVTP